VVLLLRIQTALHPAVLNNGNQFPKTSPVTRRRSKNHPALGGRPRGWGDIAELIVARLAGRNLRVWEAILVRVVSLTVAIALIVVIGIPVAMWFGQWFGNSIADSMRHSMGTPLPSHS
jgi:hypothetical protein